MIWVYEKGRERLFRAPVSEIAVEKDFYTIEPGDGTRDSNSVEDYLAQVEELANPVIRKIRDGMMIAPAEKESLSRYVALMLKRVPRNVKRMRQLMPRVAESVQTEVVEMLARSLDDEARRSGLVEALQTEVGRIVDECSRSFRKRFYPQCVDVRLTPVLSAMRWVFLVNRGDSPFLTNDNPCFFFESIGIARRWSEVTLPLSSETALWATWNEGLEEGFRPANERVVREINRRTVSGATRYVFAPVNAEWIVELVNKKGHALNRLV